MCDYFAGVFYIFVISYIIYLYFMYDITVVIIQE